MTKKSLLELVIVNLKKKSLFKSNIQVTKGMTFKNLIIFIFLFNPPEGKWFIAKSSLNLDGKVYLPKQVLEDVFLKSHV